MNILIENVESNDYVSKNAKNNLKKFIKKTLKDHDKINYLQILENINNEIILRYLVKDEDITNNFEFKIEDTDKGIFLKMILIKEYSKEKIRKMNRMKLKNKLKSFRNNQNKMTEKQYKNKTKKEKKEMTNDPRVTEEMITNFYILKNSIKVPGGQFPTPTEILNNKDEHMQNFHRYITMIKQMAQTNKSSDDFYDNVYVKYISSVFRVTPNKLINSFS